MFVVFAQRKSTRRVFVCARRGRSREAARACVNWYGRCFWCSAAGHRRDVQTRESDNVSWAWRVGRRRR